MTTATAAAVSTSIRARVGRRVLESPAVGAKELVLEDRRRPSPDPSSSICGVTHSHAASIALRRVSTVSTTIVAISIAAVELTATG